MTTDILKSSRDWAHSTDGWILVVDDHPLFCDALELTLRSVVPGADVRTSNTMAGGLDALKNAPAPRFIALDLNLPDVSGLDGVISIRRAADKTPILIVSSMDDPRMVSSAMAAGANGFVPKHSPRAILESAINAVIAGQSYQPDDFCNADDPVSEAVSRLSSLTAQQSRILELICEGKLNKQIAYDLSIAETTVKAHVTAIMRKLGVQSRTQAVLVSQRAQFSAILPEG